MIDCAYVVGTALFFVLLLGYVRACERLGRTSAVDVARAAGAHT